MSLNLCLPLLGQVRRFLNRFVYSVVLAALSVLITACVSGGGGGGGGSSPNPAPERVGLFSHVSYDFALLNTTQTGRAIDPNTLDARTLGLIDLEDAEVRAAVRARLPAGSTRSTDYTVAYTIVGGANDLTRAFFRLQEDNSARLLFQAAERYNRRAYTLDYVVNTLGVDELDVAANISYVDAAGANQTLGVFTVPVRIRAVASVPAVNDFLVFEGIRRSGTEQRARTRTGTETFDAGRLSETINTTVTKRLAAFTTTWPAADYAADTDEPTPGVGLDLDQLLTSAEPRQTRQELAVRVTLTLDNNSATQVTGDYMIQMGTNITTINGNSSVDDSFLGFLKELNMTDDVAAFVAIDPATDHVGSNVTALTWSFAFAYTAQVTRPAGTESVRVESRTYTAEGALAENAAGRTDVGGLTQVFRALGITIKDLQELPAGYDRVPTLYFRVRNANNSSPYQCARAFYLDQAYENYEDYAMKAQAAQNADEQVLDHENRSAYACRLEASLRGFGANYTAIRTTNLTDSSNQTTAVAGMAVAGTRNAASCGAAEARRRLDALRTFPGCVYQAGLAIAVEDVNEPVTLSLDVAGGAQDEANIGFAGDARAAEGTPLNTSAPDPVLATLTYREQDEDAAGNRLRVGAPMIAAIEPAMVSPTGGDEPVATTGLFYIARNATQADTAHLMLRASAAAVLDYEALTANATGQRRFSVTIQATDNSAAALTTAAEFNLEVRDVVYAPANFTYTPLVTNHSTARDPVEQRLLPGLAQFVANGGPVLGRLSAQDPESNTAAGLTYQYVGISPLERGAPLYPVRLIQNSSFALSRNPANELLLVGLGLRGEYPGFAIQLRAINPSPRANASAPLSVATAVDYRAVPTDTDYNGRPPVTFTGGVFQGLVVEGRADVPVRRRAAPTEALDQASLLPGPVNANALFFLMTDAEIANLLPAEGMLGDDARRALASRLTTLSGSEQFNLNETTGALSLHQAADFTAQPVYTLLLRVANTRDRDRDDYLSSDYAVVQVVVEDTNTAPRIVELTAVGDGVQVDDDQDRVLFTVAENVASGAALATWTVEDDNPLTDLHFDPATGATAYRIELDPDQAPQRVAATATKPAHYVASYRLVTARPDYEADATINERHQFNDHAQYEYDPLRQQRVPKTMGNTGANATTLRVNGSIEDVNEAPALRFAADAVDVMEDAAQNTPVVMVTAMDPEGMAANLTYTLTTNPTSLASAFNVGNVSATPTNADGREATWMLQVADEEALENAGDGQIFTLTLTATDPGDESVSARLDITVVDVQRFDASAVNTTLVRLREQEALDDPARVLRAPLFRFADVQPDYDEYFFGLGPDTPNPVRFGEVAFEAGAIGYVTPAGAPNTEVTDGLRDEERFNLFTLTANGAAVDLVLGEAGLIEPNLLGNNLTVEVQLTDPAGAGTPALTEVPVAILPTNPEGWRFADVRDDTRQVPAAYNFGYTQTNYADGGAPCVAGNQTYVRIDEQCYATVPVREDAEGDPVFYAARDVANQQELVAPDTVNASDGGFGVLVTNDINVRGLAPAAITIYSLDDQGNLQAAEDDFGIYFTYTVNTSYGSNNRTALVLRQRMHAVLYANGSVNPAARYAALDTLLLDSANQEEDLNYFFVVGDDEDNASRRAIAQVNFNVQTAELNEPAEVIHLNLTDTNVVAMADLANAFNLMGASAINENGADAPNFPSDVVNFARGALALGVRNPDGAAKNQTVAVTVDIVASAGHRGSSDGDARALLTTGRVTGNQLARLGHRADDARSLMLGRGVTQRSSVDVGRFIPFQLARNAHGEAFIRVKFEERAADGRAFEPHYQYFPLRVNDVPEATSTITNVTIGGLISPVAEDAFVVESNLDRGTHLNITLTNDQFDAPRSLRIANARVSIQNSDHAGFAPDPDESTIGIDLDPDVPNRIYVDRALTYAAHAHGATTFTLTTTGSEPRGFDDTRVNYAATQQLQSATFEVRPVNDPIQVCGDRNSPCNNDPRLDILTVDSPLEEFDNNYGELRSIGTLAAYFTDEDLTTNGSLPTTIMIRGVDSANASLRAIFSFNASNFEARNIRPMRASEEVADADPRVIKVRAELWLAVASQDQYNRLNANRRTQLNVTVEVLDGDNASSMALADSILISLSVAGANATVTGGIASGAEVMLPGNSDVGTRLAPPFTITDTDLVRLGDTYIFAVGFVEPTYNLSPNFLVWQGPASIPQSSSASVDRSLQTSRRLSDADAGLYGVRWSITDQEGGKTNVSVGAFRLNVTDVNDVLTASPTAPAANATYVLQTDFRAGGVFRAGLVTRNLIFSFTDADLATAASTAARGGAASMANVLDMTPVVKIFDRDGVEVNRATDTRFVLGAVAVTNPSGNSINVTVPIGINLTAAQYDVLDAMGGDLFQVNVTLEDRDVYGGTYDQVNATGYIVLDDLGADASTTSPANTYDGGAVVIYREQAIIGSNTPGEEAVFLASSNHPINISVIDYDIGSDGKGDTYNYSIVNVTFGPQQTPVDNFLAWEEETQDVARGARENRTTNYIRFEPLNAPGLQPGNYTVSWAIAEARDQNANGVANGTFTLVIEETPAPMISTLTSTENIFEGNLPGSSYFRLSIANPAGIPGAVFFNVSSATLNNRILWTEDNDGNDDGMIILGLESRLRNVNNTRYVNSFTNAILYRIPNRITSPDPFEDEDVNPNNPHILIVTTYTTTYDGRRQSVMTDLNLRVRNDPDRASVDTAGALADSVITDNGMMTLANFSLDDDDLRIPGAGRVTKLDSNFKIAFNARGVASTTCTIAHSSRSVTPVDADPATGVAVYAGLTFNLADCVKAGNITTGIRNLYELGQSRPVRITEVAIDRYNIPADDDVADADADALLEESQWENRLVITTGVTTFGRVVRAGAINTTDELIVNLVDHATGAYFLTANLTLTSWTPVTNFSGTFDGDHYNITFDGATGPLFNTISDGATVMNLGVINSILANINRGNISNSFATGASSCSGGCDSGGLVKTNHGIINGSHATGASTGYDSGGLVGENRGIIRYSYATGRVRCNNDYCTAGGLVGRNSRVVENSYATNSRTDCSGNEDFCDAGGLVGKNTGTIRYSYSIGSVDGETGDFGTAGGLAGENGGTIMDSYTTTAVHSDWSGGVVGESTGGKIINTYATGRITQVGGGEIGRLAVRRGGTTITASYGTHGSAGRDGRSSEQRSLAQLQCPTMTNETCEGATTYTGWNGTIWDFGDNETLPTLTDLPTCPTFRPNCRH